MLGIIAAVAAFLAIGTMVVVSFLEKETKFWDTVRGLLFLLASAILFLLAANIFTTQPPELSPLLPFAICALATIFVALASLFFFLAQRKPPA